MSKKKTWLLDIIEALNNLEGKAKLKNIYKKVELIRYDRKDTWPKSANAAIRKELEVNSSHSTSFKGKDIFYSVKGLGQGEWGIRTNYKDNIKNNKDVNNYIVVPEEIINNNKWKREVNRISKSILETVNSSNGDIIYKKRKIKKMPYTKIELDEIINDLLVSQNFRCKITGKKLEPKNINNPWLYPSPDRIDSNGHYTKDNIQILSWAANRAKSDIDPEDVNSFF